MDSLLPSEMARLVLGYLEDQKCDEAARSFLEMCPHLGECRAVTSSGRRFSTRVNGFTLTDILEKFCSANAIIQERLSKVSDSEQLKHCGDLLEQLRFLVDGSRSQRFVVNINVPTASQASGGSPIISSSMRKRHHSSSERDRTKRAHKSHSHTFEKPCEPVPSQMNSNAVETTSLEHLPGNCVSEITKDAVEKLVENAQEQRPSLCSAAATEAIGSQSLPENRRKSEDVQSISLPDFNMLRNLDACTASTKVGDEKREIATEKCSAATDTEELTRFTNTEVQTTPYDVVESETEMIDEPVENLSLLTKELLNRTELQQTIAENINKALPADVSLRDVSLTESFDGEINTSIMTELNNAIKFAVNATESDPGFAKLLDDIIGPSCENDTSPDEDADHQPLHPECHGENNPQQLPKELPAVASTRSSKKPLETETTEVPLKNRLRSSSSQQLARSEEDRMSSQKPDKRDDAALEDLNAAAIFSIISVNSKSKKEPPSLDLANGSLDANLDADKKIVISHDPEAVAIVPTTEQKTTEPVAEVAESDAPSSSLDEKPSRKSNARKSRAPRQKPKAMDVVPESLISEEDIMAMPTLIISSREEISSLIGIQEHPKQPIVPGGLYKSQYLQIAPKTDGSIISLPKPEPMYLRTVNVPVTHYKPLAPKPDSEIKRAVPYIVPKAVPQAVSQAVPKAVPQAVSRAVPKAVPKAVPQAVPACRSRPGLRQRGRAPQRKSKVVEQEPSTLIVENNFSTIVDQTPVLPAEEKITLYGENSADVVIDEITAVQVDETISVSGTGLSPFLKFNNGRSIAPPEDVEMCEEKATNPSEPSVPAISIEPVVTEQPNTSISKQNSYDVLTKRTPRSLLKSRSKNHRLSLSTPRRRSSHIRALDFNTPTKGMNSSRRLSANDSLQFSPKTSNFVKTLCRTSLFKSPTGTETPSTPKTIKSPVKDCKPCKIPIATRSPAPKLMGGWDKLTGVGLILGSTSASSSPVKISTTSQVATKSWDADLRKSLALAEESQTKLTKKSSAKKLSTKRRTRKKTVLDQSFSQIEECSSDCEWLPPAEGNTAQHNDLAAATKVPAVEKAQPRTDGSTLSDDSKKLEVAPDSESSSKKVRTVVSGSNEKAVIENQSGGTSGKSATITSTTKTAVTTLSNAVVVTSAKIVKKYAQLKTITTNVTRIDRVGNAIEVASIAAESTDRSSEFSQTCSAESSRQISILPDMLSLETPRKFDNAFGIPPTPRVLSPSSSVCSQAPFRPQVGEDSGKMRSFVTTPEFPPTPSIAVTPKQINENTIDASKREEFITSYYQPNSELKDPRMPKNDQSRHDMSLPLPGLIATANVNTSITDLSVQVAEGFQASTTSNKLEITQFEVIKENLSREEAFRELKISSTAKEVTETSGVEETNAIRAASSIGDQNDVQENKDADNSGSTVDDDSSDSDSSDSSSNSSSSSSSSCSSSSNGTNTSANTSFAEQYGKKTPNKIRSDIICESVDKTANASCADAIVKIDAPNNAQGQDRRITVDDVNTMERLASSKEENEASPQKVFPIAKTEEALKESIQETPAKDDSLLSEAVISETPSSSKAGIETLTNLNTKISALITSEDRDFARSKLTSVAAVNVSAEPRRVLPKIISVQRILPNVSIALKPSPVGETSYTAMHSRNPGALQASAMSNAKLSRQLEEKRLRTLAKFKETEKPSPFRTRTKRAVAAPKGRKSKNEKDNSFEEEPDKSDETGSEKLKNTNLDDQSKQDSSEVQKRTSSPIRETAVNHEDAKKNAMKAEQDARAEAAAKAERMKKSQMFKELFDESMSETLTPAKQRVVDEPEVCTDIAETEKKKKDKSAERKKHEVRAKTQANIAEEAQGRIEPESKLGKQSTRATGPMLGELQSNKKMMETLNLEATEEVAVHSWENAKSDKEEGVVQMSASSQFGSKIAAKSKVDLVKRDLFSDEESNDQRATRSRTRQHSDAQRSDSADSHRSASSDPRAERATTPQEEMPGVLECLQLVPAIKSDTADEDINALETSQCHAEFHYVYDDSVPTKRRKRRFSSSDLEFDIQVGRIEENTWAYTTKISATPYEELFNLSPPRRRRGPAKETLAKTTKYKKKDASASTSGKSMFKDIQDQPLATSSPVFKAGSSKVAGKAVKSPVKKSDSRQTDTKKKTTAKTDKLEHDKPSTKSRKRKASNTAECDQQVDKKPRATDPQLLSKLSKVDLDKFLTTVHGPA